MYTAIVLASKLKEFLEQKPRYPVILVQGPPRSGKTIMLRQALDSVSALYIDYLKDVMCGSEPPVLGAFASHDFLDWIIERSRSGTVFVDEADPLFSTWSPSAREIFWRRLLRLETPYPVVVTTRLIEIEPPDTGHGVGLVWRL